MPKEQPKEMEKWGRDTARERYGSASEKMTGSTEHPKCDVVDSHGPSYNNDVPNNWLRGNGQEPGFDKGGR